MKQFSKELGKVSITPKGNWDSSITNERLDIVYDRRNNQAYIAKQDVPIGVDIDNREYWQPLNVSGYADNNFINLTAENENGTITAYESLEEAVATIFPINRRVGATLSFYNLNSDRLDRQAEFELWQFNSTDLANWENKDYWNNIYYNWNVFAGWYIDADALKNHVEIPNVGQYAYVGSNLNDALLYQCRTNGTWTNTGIKVRNYISVVVSGNITIGDNGNWFSDGEDTGIPATPAVDEQFDNIIMQLQQHTTEINNLKASDTNLQDQITSNDSDITNLTAKHESLSRTVQGIAATGGASTATNVTYNNDASGLNAENAQDAIDELQGSKIDKTSILQESGDAEDKVMSQKAVSDKLVDLSNKKLSKDSDSDSSVSDGSDEFVVTDAANKVALKVDKEGTKVKILNICDENGKVVKTITSEEVSEDTKSFSIIDLKGNKSLEVDNDGVKARKYIICDENGNIVKVITDELLNNIEQNKQNNLWWKGKNIFLLGDSLGQIRDIQRVFSQYSMSNWYTEYVSAVLSAGGTQTLSRYTLDGSGDQRATYLKQIQEDRGLSIDVIFFMTNNDVGTFSKNIGTKFQEPYFESQILRSSDILLSSVNYKEEFKSNFASIMANAQTKIVKALTYGTRVSWSEKGAVSPKGHTLLFVPIEYDDINVFKLKINKNSTVSGSVKIKSSISGFKENVITIAAGDSVEDILNKILICDFGIVLDIAISDTEITFTNNTNPKTNNISIECSSEEINSLFSLSNSIGNGYVEKPFVYKSLDTTNWNNADYWVLRDTEYTSENDPQSAISGPSAWQVYGGMIQYLQLTFPRALIIGLYPTVGWGKTDGYKYKNSQFIDYAKFRSESRNNYESHRKIMKEIFNYYCCPFIDFNECSGISAVNAIPGGFYPPDGNIHPYQGDNGGSARWGVTLANVLL